MSVKNKMYDNLLKVIAVKIAMTTTISSIEIDLELPRGFVARIKQVILKLISTGVPLDGTNLVECALVRDPDDTESTDIPENATQHDVIADLHEAFPVAAAGYRTQPPPKIIVFNPEDDIITARNMRFNCISVVVDYGNAHCTIYYTLEKVKADIVLELLDIL